MKKCLILLISLAVLLGSKYIPVEFVANILYSIVMIYSPILLVINLFAVYFIFSGEFTDEYIKEQGYDKYKIKDLIPMLIFTLISAGFGLFYIPLTISLIFTLAVSLFVIQLAKETRNETE